MSRSDDGPPYGGDVPRVSVTDGLLGFLPGIDPGTRRILLTSVGVGSLLMAVVLVAAPWLPVWLVGPFLPLLLLANPLGIALVAGGVGLFGAWWLYRNSGSAIDEAPSVTIPSPDPEADDRSVDHPGGRLDTLVDRVSGDSDNPSKGVNRAVDKRQVRKILRDLAVDVLREAHDLSREEALDHLDAGTWTTSRRASAFLGSSEAPGPTVSTRIRDWASGDAFERRVRATADEVARVDDRSARGGLLDAEFDRVEGHRPAAGVPGDPRERGESSAPSLDLDAPGGDPEFEVDVGDGGTDRAASTEGGESA